MSDYRITLNSRYYAEVHHIWPLGEGGVDNFDNMLVLCPTHHAEFDLAVLALDPKDGTSVVDIHTQIVGKIHLAQGHSLRSSNLEYQMRRLKENLN
ncbi:MAG: HNH endonuclease [Nitrososphaerales archaeon]